MFPLRFSSHGTKVSKFISQYIYIYKFVFENLLNNNDVGIQKRVVMLYLSSMVDTIDHDILVYVLTALSLLTDYIEGCSFTNCNLPTYTITLLIQYKYCKYTTRYV